MGSSPLPQQQPNSGTPHDNTVVFGYKTTPETVASPQDPHSSTLNPLGLDHKKLTFRFNGRDIHLSGVRDELIKPIRS